MSGIRHKRCAQQCTTRCGNGMYRLLIIDKSDRCSLSGFGQILDDDVAAQEIAMSEHLEDGPLA